MTHDALVAAITKIAEPLVASMGLSLWGVELALGGRSVLRVFVEGAEGVDIDQCAKVSRLLGLALDVEEILTGPYVLEVSSPGLERHFFTPAQLASGVGNHVTLTLHAPLPALPGRKKMWGRLVGAAGDDFVLEVHDVGRPGEPLPLLPFSWSQVKKAQQMHFLPEAESKPAKGKKPAAPKEAAEKKKKKALPAEEDT